MISYSDAFFYNNKITFTVLLHPTATALLLPINNSATLVFGEIKMNRVEIRLKKESI